MSTLTTPQVAQKLVDLCTQGKFEDAVKSLYATNIVSVEGWPMNGRPRETRGLDAILQKHHWWADNHTIHSIQLDGPYSSVEKFSVLFNLDVTFKPASQRIQMREIAIYTVEAGKIVHEEFLYSAAATATKASA